MKKKSQIFAKSFFSDHQLWPMTFFGIFGIFFKATTSNTVFYFDFLLESPENHRNHDFNCFSMFLAKNLAKKLSRKKVMASDIFEKFQKMVNFGKYRQFFMKKRVKKGQKKKKMSPRSTFPLNRYLLKNIKKHVFLSFWEHFE